MLRKFVLITLSLAIIAGIIFRLRVPDCGLAEIDNVKDMQTKTIVLSYALGANNGDEDSLTETSFKTNDSRYDVEAASIIAVVEPTGNIRQTEGSMGQEIVFQEIIKGSEFASVQQKGYVYQYFGFHETDGAIQFMNVLNLMYPENKYLIFLDASPLNTYMQNPVYILKSSFLGIMNINGHSTKTLNKNFQDYSFSELADYEFFSVSEKITSVLNSIKKEVLNRYLSLTSNESQ